MFNFLNGSDAVSPVALAASANYGVANDKVLFGSWYAVWISAPA